MDARLLLDEVFDVDFVLHVLDLGEAVVAVFLPDLQELVLENGLDLIFVGEDLLVIGDLFFQLLVLRLELLFFKTLEAL